MDSRWSTYQERLALADRYKRDFVALNEATNLIEEHPSVGSFRFVSGADLLRCTRLPSYPEVRGRLRSHEELQKSREGNLHFVSHRWLSREHPDPDGRQLQLLAPAIDAADHYWIDYSCLPQQARTPEEERAFKESMTRLPSLMFNMHFLMLRCRGDDYFARAWCFFETLTGNVLGRALQTLSERDADSTQSIERDTLERTLASRQLPDSLATTVPADLTALQEMTKTVAMFFELRLVEQYMSLGQILSDQKLFWGEDPYYYVAACDFSGVMSWVFDKARALGMHLIDLTRDAWDDNFFAAMARREEFHYALDPYALPRKVVLDQSRLGWFIVNKHARDSAHNLFFLMTAMIRP